MNHNKAAASEDKQVVEENPVSTLECSACEVCVYIMYMYKQLRYPNHNNLTIKPIVDCYNDYVL